MTSALSVERMGDYREVVESAMMALAEARIVARIWERDHTVWRPDPQEIANRLGWLDIATRIQAEIPRIETLRDTLLDEGYTDVLLLGMGGSSLAPEVFSKVFGGESQGLRLEVLDSTDAGAVRAQAERLDLARTLFIVATKSGGTVETLSFFKYFYNRVSEALGAESAGAHFIAITDPGSRLEVSARALGFRDIFLNDPEIGGRNSALSFFGLAPAVLIGVDVPLLLKRATAMMKACGGDVPLTRNPAAWLGAALGALAKQGRDKATLVTSERLAPFGDWIEQLVAESTGKDGQGILLVVGESLAPVDHYGADRLFISMTLAGDEGLDMHLLALQDAGQPVVDLSLLDIYDLGGQFFLWELATAIAGAILNIQPFNQPNVESAKIRARQMVASYQEQGTLPEIETSPATPDVLKAFVEQGRRGDYIAIQAYIQPTPETDALLHALREQLRALTGLATTGGYGPRYLHSTGQLHKGDAGNGLFVQFTSDPEEELAIPDAPGDSEASITFGVLKLAQALGDRQALLDAGRRVITFHLGVDVVGGLRRLVEALS
ncbi:MAG: glucose-6-phosphate isomerase [Anaerolineae bacterium]|nr:glucose-6-phosphate isomerase [Anaerolineae bacterium]